MIKLIPIFACLIFAFVRPALASRTIFIPPLYQSTVHGGLMGGTTCITADMLAAANYGGGESGVGSAYQNFRIAFKNLSNLNQSITISVLPGSRVSGGHSRGSAVSVPDTENTPRTVSTALTHTIVLGPLADGAFDVVAQTTNTSSSIRPWDPDLSCSGAAQVCLGVSSTMIFKIEVAEDKGAVQANITTTSHRCYGYRDHYLQPPLMYQVNGGRAF